MDAKPFTLMSLWVLIAFSILISSAEGAIGDSMPCVKILLPCKDYLSNPTSPPPTCCYPLKHMISNDTACLCQVLNDKIFLKQLNITSEDVLKLPIACGAKADISICNKEATSPATAPIAKAPSIPGQTKDSSATSGTFGRLILLVVSMALTLATI